jgi:hypothetical protein
VVHLTIGRALPDASLRRLDGALEGYPGPDQVMLHVEDGDQAWDMELPRRVSPGDELRHAVEEVLGPGTYQVQVVRRKATERRPFTPRNPPPAQDEPVLAR